MPLLTYDDALECLLPFEGCQMLYDRYWGESLNDINELLGDHSYRYLDLGVPMDALLRGNRLVILSQYEYFYQRIMAIKDSPSQGVVLTGNPGIGKSSFLIFMLLKCLVEQEQVIWALHGVVYVFDSNGVFTTRPGINLARYFDRPSWRGVLALVDPDHNVGEPDPGLVHTGLFPVHASSPQIDHYKVWAEQRWATMLVMDPLTTDDMHVLVSLASPNCTRDEIEVAVSKYGTNSRTIAKIFTRPNGTLLQEEAIRKALHSFPFSRVAQEIISPQEGGTTISRAIIQSASSTPPPQVGDPNYLSSDMITHSIASRYIWKLLYKNFMGSSLREIRRLFVFLAETRSAGVMRDLLFEAWCHDRLCHVDVASDLTEMVKDQSQHLVRGQNMRTLPLDRKRAFELYLSSARFSEAKDGDKYYVPQEGNNPTFNSFVRVSDQVGIGFRMTISPDHTLKMSGLRLLARCLNTEERLFVFVIPAGHTFRCQAPSAPWMSKFKFYTLEVDFGHFADHEKMNTDLPPEPSSDIDMDITDSE